MWGENRFETRLADEDWHAICQSIFEDVEDRGMGELVPQVRGDMNEEVNVRLQVGAAGVRRCGR